VALTKNTPFVNTHQSMFRAYFLKIDRAKIVK